MAGKTLPCANCGSYQRKGFVPRIAVNDGVAIAAVRILSLTGVMLFNHFRKLATAVKRIRPAAFDIKFPHDANRAHGSPEHVPRRERDTINNLIVGVVECDSFTC